MQYLNSHGQPQNTHSVQTALQEDKDFLMSEQKDLFSDDLIVSFVHGCEVPTYNLLIEKHCMFQISCYRFI
jgi:hypothetical protein